MGGIGSGSNSKPKSTHPWRQYRTTRENKIQRIKHYADNGFLTYEEAAKKILALK